MEIPKFEVDPKYQCLLSTCRYFEITQKRFEAINTVLRFAVDNDDISFLKAGNYMLYKFIRNKVTKAHISCAKKCGVPFIRENESIEYVKRRVGKVSDKHVSKVTLILLGKVSKMI